ncbi:MAG: hypothetical protein LBJ88_01290 [Campylobacteraceae bacterium]|nr:hypothetical protein [Campylobacteraceae bacterium]
MYKDVLIYEYKNYYYIIQRSTQGKEYDERVKSSENVVLYSKLELNCPIKQLGNDVSAALENYNKIRPKFEPWELGGLNKQFCSWVGAKGRKSFDRDSRCVQVIKNNKLEIIPFDNCNKNGWYGPMIKEMRFKNKITTIEIDSTFETIGWRIKKAFKKSTYNPNKKYKKEELL